MKADNPLTEVFERNSSYWEHKKVILAGQIPSLQLLNSLIKTEKAFVLTDNYTTAQGLAAMMGIKLGKSEFEIAQKRHVSVIFSDIADNRLQEHLEEVDTIVLFLNKTKSLSQEILSCLMSVISPKVQILIMGANAIGGKSGDSLVKDAANVFKVDTARKCTVFAATLNEGAKFKDTKSLPDVSFGGLKLEQSHGIFSQGELDRGTHLLLNAMHRDLSGESKADDASKLTDLSSEDLKSLPTPRDHAAHYVLDLGCGSGIIGLSLAARGYKHVVCSDISATALHCTLNNAKLNGLEVEVLASDMLPKEDDLREANISVPGGRFNIIATNPPFHQGINRTTSQTLNMIAKVKDSLTSDGVLYLVGNTALHYEDPLSEAFTNVEVIASTTKFTVFKAYNS